jgi:YD repeat-containing protein
MNTASFRLDQLSEQNPWPGLRAFTEADREFFFGREHEAAELLSLVQRAPVVVLYGQSGLGKTSLIQAGLFPALKRLNFLPLRLRFDQSDNAPPLAQQLKNALAGELDRAGIAAPRPGQDETLWEYFHRRDADFWGPRNRLLSPVIVFDQFEEVFTLGQRSEHAAARVRQFAAELESLLEHRPPDSIRERLEANPDEVLRYDLQRQSVKFVLSLREDFLPNLDPWRVRMPSLLPHRFRLERMTGAEALEVVQRAGQQLVEPAVARDIVDFVSTSQRKRLTRAVEQRDVEPALLSVVCDELNRRRLERGQAQITSDLLTLEREGIIRGFYERAFNGVDARVRDWVEDELLTASGFRDRAALEDALKLGLPTVGFDQLVDRRILHREEREGVIWLELTHDLLADPAQHSRTVREQRRQVQAAAERERELEHQREVQRRRARLLAGLSVGLALLCLAILGGLWRHWYNYDRPYVLYYKHFTKRWGIPHGIGLLDKGQIEHRRSSLRFTYRGKRGPLIRVQAVDYAGRLTYRHDVGTYLDSAPGEKPDRECQWEFIFDTKGGVAYEMAYDKRSNLVWGFVYSPATADKTERVAHFVGPNGLPRPLARSSADYVRFEYTPDGLEKRLSYSDSFGRPQPRPDLAFSVSMQYDTAGRLVRAESRDARGRLMLDDTKSAILTIAYDGQGNPVEENWLNPEGQPTLTADGYARIKADYDEWGNWTKCAYGDTDGNPTIVRPGYFRVAARYDPRGNQTEWACFDTHGQPTVEKSGGYHAVRKEYDDRGDWTNCVYVGVNGRETIGKIGYSRISARYDEKGNQLAWACFDARGQAATDRSDGSHMLKSRYDSLGHRIEAAYFGLRASP